MCGIIGYVGSQPALPLLIQGLKRLEYRGYDSAGVAVLGTTIQVVKAAGKIANLEAKLAGQLLPGTIGIAHTRWATHGAPTDWNAHPHLSCDGGVAVVHNGIFENAAELRSALEARGHRFCSETDTEVVAHLIEDFLAEGDDLVKAVQKTHAVVSGAYGIAVLSAFEPDLMVAARHGSPLVVGLTEHGTFVASDPVGFREQTDQVVYLEDGQMVVVERTGYRLLTLANEAVEAEVRTLTMSIEELSKGGYPHFMLKEIMEQPEALRRTLAGRLQDGSKPQVTLGGFEKSLADGRPIKEFLQSGMQRIVLTACGTSWHACLIGRRMLEKLLRLPVTVEYASEYATGPTLLDPATLLVDLTQSGETKDLLEAVRKAKVQGAVVWNICNVVDSSITRLADSGIYLHVGPEIGVASTKAFTAQVVALALLTLKLVELRGPAWVTLEGQRAIAAALLEIPDQVQDLLRNSYHVRSVAEQFAESRNALYLGRGYNFPTALEGALKLKEIAYVHAEGYPAGEMKHGPIALIDENMPVIIIAPREGEDEGTYARIMSNLEEVRTRGGRVILIASEGDRDAGSLQAKGRVERVLYLPKTLAMFTPVLASVDLQLFAYHMAALRGCEIDQPRNLAKSVTVL